jgi:3',5'-cyclic-AMP phosphodiesterase
VAKRIVHDHNHDGVDRRGFLECMAWGGTGVLWSVSGGVLSSQAMGQKLKDAKGELHFVQISDTHMGFNKPANPDVAATLQVAIDRINALPQAPEFLIHTGDLTHSSKSEEFDTLDQRLKGVKSPADVFRSW